MSILRMIVLTAMIQLPVFAGTPVNFTYDTTNPFTYGLWHSSRIGGGGYLQQVAISSSNPQRVYMSSDVGGCYRSDDGGITWKMLHGNMPLRLSSASIRGISVDPRNPDRVIVCAGTRWATGCVCISENGGSSWDVVLDNVAFFGNWEQRSAGSVIARHPYDPDILLVATSQTGIFRSSDGGDTWQHVGMNGLNPIELRYDQSNPMRIWMTSAYYEGTLFGGSVTLESGFYVSETTGGTEWTKISDVGPSEFVQDPSDPDIMYGIFGSEQIKRSVHNGGEIWEAYRDGLPPMAEPLGSRDKALFRAIVAGPNFVLAASTVGQFYLLNKNQNRWDVIEKKSFGEGEWFGQFGPGHGVQHFGSALGNITIFPDDPNHWIMTDWYAAYQTWDAGINWWLTIDGVEMSVIHDLEQNPNDPAELYLGMADNGYFKSYDGARTFLWNRHGITNNIKCIKVSKSNPSWVYAVGTKGTDWVSNQVYVSEDSGIKWRLASMYGLPDMNTHYCNTLVTHPNVTNQIFLAVSGTLGVNQGGPYVSFDEGENWQWIGQGLPEGANFFHSNIWRVGSEIACDVSGNLLAISYDQKSLFVRKSNQTQCQTLTLPSVGKPSDIQSDPTVAGCFYLATNPGGLYMTNDWGDTWQNLHDGNTTHVTVDALNRLRIACDTGSDVIVSTTGGTQWQSMGAQLPLRFDSLTLAFAGDRLVVGTQGSGVFWIPLNAQASQPMQSSATVPDEATRLNIWPSFELFSNGSMTDGETSPDGWQVTNMTIPPAVEAVRDTVDYVSGPASMRIQTSHGPVQATVRQTISGSQLPSEPFIIQAYAKASDGFTEAKVYAQVFNATWGQLAWHTIGDLINNGNEWNLYQKQITLPTNAAYILTGVIIKGQGTVWMDDAKGVYVSTGQSFNLYTNGSMTLGDTVPESWQVVNTTPSPTVSVVKDDEYFISDPFSMKIQTSNGNVYAAVRQTISQNDIPSQRFAIEGCVKMNGLFEFAQIYAQLFDENWHQLSWVPVMDFINNSGQWEYCSKEIVIPSETKFLIGGVIFKGQGSIFVDEIKGAFVVD